GAPRLPLQRHGTTRLAEREGQPSCRCACLPSVRPTNSVTRPPHGERAGTHRRRSAAICESCAIASAGESVAVVAVPRVNRGTGRLPTLGRLPTTALTHVFTRSNSCRSPLPV